MQIAFVDALCGDFTELRRAFAARGDEVVSILPAAESLEIDTEPDLIVVASTPWTEDDVAACRRLRRTRVAAPVVAVRVPADARTTAAILRAGADEVVTYVAELDDLIARVLAVHQRVSARPRYVRAGPFLVDGWHRELMTSDGVVTLTPREYDLFLALRERIGEVVTRGELAARIPRGGADGTASNVVDVNMSRLRAKLGVHAAVLEAVRGQGYRLRC